MKMLLLEYPKRYKLKYSELYRKMSRKVTVIIEKGKELYSAYIPDDITSAFINGQGYSVFEAIEDMKIALEEIKEYFIDEGRVIPEDISGEIEFEYRYDIPSLLEEFEQVNLSSFARANGLNVSMLRKYRNGLAFATEEQYMRIEAGLQRLVKPLTGARLKKIVV
jgi:predicted RNase H-like HicB family nuclease